MQISVGDKHNVWGVSDSDDVFQWTGHDWKVCACAPAPFSLVWVPEEWGSACRCPAGNGLLSTLFLYSGNTCARSECHSLNGCVVWAVRGVVPHLQQIPGKLISVAVAPGGKYVVGANRDNHVFGHDGMLCSVPLVCAPRPHAHTHTHTNPSPPTPPHPTPSPASKEAVGAWCPWEVCVGLTVLFWYCFSWA